MPNWVTNRLTLSGPHAEIVRFQNTCIRATLEEDSDGESLDLGALVPMPAVIVATLDDHSTAVKQAALEATGFEDWYDWRLHHWGCKWNTSNFRVITVATELFDVSFQTPWSAPEPALAALATQFPLLSGRACAIEDGEDWGLIGEFQAGSYNSTFVDGSTELKYLVYGWRLNSHLRLNSGLVLAEPSGDIQEIGDGVLARIWTKLDATLAPEFMARLCFEIDAQRFRDWHDANLDISSDDGEACELRDMVQNPLNLDFLSAEGRCQYPIDRNLMCLLAQGLAAEWSSTSDAAQIERGVRRDLAYLLFEHDEDELSEWAFHAIVRQQGGINFADLTSLQESFIRYAKVMREQILQHLECVQAALMSRPSGQVGLRLAPDPLRSCVTLS
jgi:Ferredoxin-like domain in Api92-like protein